MPITKREFTNDSGKNSLGLQSGLLLFGSMMEMEVFRFCREEQPPAGPQQTALIRRKPSSRGAFA